MLVLLGFGIEVSDSLQLLARPDDDLCPDLHVRRPAAIATGGLVAALLAKHWLPVRPVPHSGEADRRGRPGVLECQGAGPSLKETTTRDRSGRAWRCWCQGAGPSPGFAG